MTGPGTPPHGPGTGGGDASPPGLHARLRAETSPAHLALEDALDWRTRVATRAGYRDLLGRLHGFHAVWEPAIGQALADDPFFDARRRLAALDADLHHLGLSPGAIAVLPRPEAVAIAGPAAAMGALYVLEGSTLGGRMIGRHIAALHGIDGDGLAYYRAHGPRTGAMWSAFRAALDDLSGDPVAEADALASAVAAFDGMRLWLCAPAQEH